jgi:hypothetical protein
MNKIQTFLAGEHCELVHDALVMFFQNMDEELSTEDMVLSFMKWMDAHQLTITGRHVTIELGEESKITEEDVNSFQRTFEKDPLGLLTIVTPPDLHIRFEPACEHLKRYHGTLE